MNQLELNLTYPERPGWKARTTSEDAADQIAPKAETLRNKCYRLIAIEPRTADECAALLEETDLTIRPRVTELSKLDKIEDSGQRRKNKSGRKAIVWQIKS